MFFQEENLSCVMKACLLKQSGGFTPKLSALTLAGLAICSRTGKLLRLLLRSKKPRTRPLPTDRHHHFFPAARASSLIGGFLFVPVNSDIDVAALEMDAEEFFRFI